MSLVINIIGFIAGVVGLSAINARFAADTIGALTDKPASIFFLWIFAFMCVFGISALAIFCLKNARKFHVEVDEKTNLLIRGLRPDEFHENEIDLLKEAKLVASPEGYKGKWYQTMGDRGSFGIRETARGGRIIDFDIPGIPKGGRLRRMMD